MSEPKIVIATPVSTDVQIALDTAMSEYISFMGTLPQAEIENIYRFAYWLFRYSNLVQPVTQESDRAPNVRV